MKKTDLQPNHETREKGIPAHLSHEKPVHF